MVGLYVGPGNCSGLRGVIYVGPGNCSGLCGVICRAVELLGSMWG